MVSDTCTGSALDPIHVKSGHGQPVSAFDNGDSVPDASTYALHVGDDRYVSPPQRLECPAQ